MGDVAKDELILACWRVADLPDPKGGSVRGHLCTDCTAEVWVMPRNLAIPARILCRPCAAERAVSTGDLVVMPAAAYFPEGPARG